MAAQPPKAQDAGAPFSRPFVVAELQRDRSLSRKIVANEAECDSAAASLGLESVASLQADFTLTGLPRGVVGVVGEVRTRLTQICVVSLDPFESELVETAEAKFVPPEPTHRSHSQPAEISVAIDEDEPEPIVDGKIDLGALALEFLALGLDPYPRKPGVEFAAKETPVEAAEESPFAALAKLKRELE
jgi:uncharacterized metal-binding protein YceD (DUF177 family)